MMKRSTDATAQQSTSKKIRPEPEDGAMNYIAAPSLAAISAVKVASAILSRFDFKSSRIDTKFPTVNATVAAALNTMQLPRPLMDEIDYTVQIMLKEINKWYSSSNYPFKDLVVPKLVLCWSMHGTVNKAETFERNIRTIPDNYLQKNIIAIYKIACLYCNEDFVKFCWSKMTITKKSALITKLGLRRLRMIDINHALIAYWTYHGRNVVDSLRQKIQPSSFWRTSNGPDVYDRNKTYSVCWTMFFCAYKINNIDAMKYFWQCLTEEERSDFMLNWINLVENNNYVCSDSDRCSVFFFLLSQITDSNEQRKIIRKYNGILMTILFVEWPWQKYLLMTLRALWNSEEGGDGFDTITYTALMLKTMLSYLAVERSIFKQIWHESPTNLKKLCVQSITRDIPFIQSIFNLEDAADMLGLILKETDQEQRKRIFTCGLSNELLLKTKREVGSSMFNCLMVKACKSSDEIVYLKRQIINYMKRRPLILHNRDENENKQCDDFLNWCFDFTTTAHEEVRNFKHKIARSGNFIVVRKIIKYGGSNNKDWGEFEMFFKWCFSSSTKDLERYKRDISRYYNIKRIVYRALRKENFAFATKVLDWCMCGDEERVRRFKNRLFLSMKMKEEISDIVDDGYRQGNLEALLKWGQPLEKRTILMIQEFMYESYDLRKKIDRSMFKALLDQSTGDGSDDDDCFLSDVDGEISSDYCDSNFSSDCSYYKNRHSEDYYDNLEEEEYFSDPIASEDGCSF